METLNNLPVEVDLKEVRRILHLDRNRDTSLLQRLIDTATPLIEAKAAFNPCYIEKKLKDAVIVNGVRLKSKVLRKNLDPVERLFPYVVTIGAGLEKTVRKISDPLEKYYLDVIGNVALTAARKYLHEYLCTKFALAKISFMSPGSLPDWPLDAQSQLFQLLTDVEDAIGVQLTQALVMIPTKSVSGIYFQTEVSFLSCQLCQRGNCPGRKARYDEKRAREYGILD
jgi:Vitamin B12 dependent methionine synthase, activation domain